MTQHRHLKDIGKRRRNVLVVLAALLIPLLAGCGNGSGTTPNTAAPIVAQPRPTSLSGDTVPNAVPTPDTTTASGIAAAVQNQIEQSVTVPYQDVRIEVLNQDEAFTTVRVHIQLRKSAESNWEDHTAIYELKQVGGQWQIDTAGQFSSPKEAYLTSVFFVSPTEGWAVGRQDAKSGENVILHFRDGTWKAEDGPLAAGLRSVYMVSADEGWAVGQAKQGARELGTILHYSDGTWEPVSIPPVGPLNNVFMTSATDGWAVGDEGALLHYAGGTWQQVESPTTAHLRSVHMASAMVGVIAANTNAFMHYDGNGWKPSQYFNVGSTQTNSVFMVSPDEAWAVGELFGIWHYKGGTWEQVESKYVGAGLNSVSMVSADEGWAVGSATILHYNGNKWEEVQSPTTADLLSVQMISADDGWVVGENGTILRYQNGAWGKYDR